MGVVAFNSAPDSVAPLAKEPRDLTGLLDLVQLGGWLMLTVAVFLVRI